MIAGLVVAALVVVVAAHYYLWRRLVRDTTRTRLGRRIGTAIVVVLGVVLLATLVASRTVRLSEQTPIAWPGYIWLALLFYLLLIVAVLELPAFAARRYLRRAAGRADPGEADPGEADPGDADPGDAEPDGPDPERVPPAPVEWLATRRLFLARTVAVSAGLASAGIVAGGMVSALGPPQLKRIEIPLAKLPRGADQTRIALVSDIHLGPLRGYSHTRRIVDMINGLDADLVAIVGDLVDGSVADLGFAASPLRELRSRYGSFFVTGNHEYFSGFQEWVDEVASFGVRPLRNERVSLPFGLDLAGVNDQSGRSYGDGPDYAKALADRDPSLPVILLAHQPVQAHEAAARGVDLQLSGHTHGGQLVPFNLVVRATGQPVVSGLGRVDGMPVYVTNGAGFWGPPVRVGAPPDITLVQLRSV